MRLISPEFIHNIAPQLDLLNTIGGGVAQPQLRIDQREKGIILRVLMPSVRPESFHVVLNDQQLTVYGEYRPSAVDAMAAPLFVQNLQLPSNLDLNRIDAVHQGSELQVRIPFKNPSDQQREISIRKS